ncbi:hypothetical protein DFA_00876 [Cavenderia fasciculata]|uniref:Transmembrane protein n=1 Tax=Cavenderia fasciculata TaxID=261658 RepID=F4PUD5_CACFS|nr:uncharacterized protein DFA_00876 [Cavenderia fasciculata]EGG21007.1 hypothetical protein DFA_00876 [Cavenderia fasciculata]|eukprot:XP_004358857.1 hypothetical protein DFA_00876 [Cavenderia fasciculata]
MKKEKQQPVVVVEDEDDEIESVKGPTRSSPFHLLGAFCFIMAIIAAIICCLNPHLHVRHSSWRGQRRQRRRALPRQHLLGAVVPRQHSLLSRHHNDVDRHQLHVCRQGSSAARRQQQHRVSRGQAHCIARVYHDCAHHLLPRRLICSVADSKHLRHQVQTKGGVCHVASFWASIVLVIAHSIYYGDGKIDKTKVLPLILLLVGWAFIILVLVTFFYGKERVRGYVDQCIPSRRGRNNNNNNNNQKDNQSGANNENELEDFTSDSSNSPPHTPKKHTSSTTNHSPRHHQSSSTGTTTAPPPITIPQQQVPNSININSENSNNNNNNNNSHVLGTLIEDSDSDDNNIPVKK